VSPKDATTDEADKTPRKRRGATTDAMRARLARIVKIVFGALATILALGALLVVLGGNINGDNAIVKFIIDTADAISGPFSKDDGIFSFSGKNAESKNALLNWGIAAIVYLLIGRVLANLIAPKGKRS
jgi:hypothetical protein